MVYNISPLPPHKVIDTLKATSNEPIFNARLVQRADAIIRFIQEISLEKKISTHEMCRIVLERIIQQCNAILNSNYTLACYELEAGNSKNKSE